ncbi:hypothetical protein [Methylogaea oryzae]|uniref:Polymerase nucleotidyl transferase domain-containing protein n=1 Tax=Methylogaea oryzae TaxID=1295382 RepID=A0A8D5ALK8_9GAMM|nr:hypothetical protein [Methylogaea oryzae]BBL72226.1 hypothetical protein MoryE10_28320 [Methylogaea oryzae]
MTAPPLPRDFLETEEGLLFAVVEGGLEEGRALCFLRYRREGGAWRKLGTDAANALLTASHPHYLYYSASRDARLHGVAMERAIVHHRPRRRLAQLMATAGGDAVESKLRRLLALLASAGVDLHCMGVTGSLLIGAQRPDSDFDLVVYGRAAFFRVRQAVADLLRAGRLEPLSDALWRESYGRRGCDLDYDDYLRHERRKYNKAVFEGVKFDITLTGEEIEPPQICRKQGPATLTARVIDAHGAFDHPARYQLDHPRIRQALSYTHTYAGQAWAGETVEIAGQVEQAADGGLRIVVGSSREAPGEYIRVVEGFGAADFGM